MAFVIESIPLANDEGGVFRVGKTRVTLDLVVRGFDRGATVEEIVLDFPSLQLSDVYQVIGYYLKHADDLKEYLRKREREEADLLADHLDHWRPPGLRERLLARTPANEMVGRRELSRLNQSWAPAANSRL